MNEITCSPAVAQVKPVRNNLERAKTFEDALKQIADAFIQEADENERLRAKIAALMAKEAK